KGYDPLSDDEKEAMTDDQIEKWETKIKDSVLRRDSTLGSLLDVMKTSMMKSVEVDGSSYSLSSYGIQTSKDYSEKGLLHIYGNKEDAVYSANEDKLMKALKEDPDTVMKVLSEISKNLYDVMNDKMSSITNVRSALTFYNDKTMAEQQSRYARQISVLEDKLIDTENKYYKQFAAMESAMAKMQSQSNALAGMLGTSGQK
ncbi:MAG: flagellar hook-associated 2 domain protein, partial [Clostridiales bacterium]|nr:flagellar hook-associated 2 domain protein [Clostridiales bacterium]